jgi:DNA end-binding protein Ku
MPRSIWNGVISFGMVSIPVKLYTGTQDKDISFHLLHKTDNTRIKMRRWCPADEKFVEMDEIVRGYEYARDQYVILTEEDFEKLPLPSKHTIELAQFVSVQEIDPVYYEKTYYLEPDQAGVKPYALLVRALEEKGLIALAKIAIRNKERLCALRPKDGVLVLETLFYPDEIRIEAEAPAAVDVSDRELDMAFTLIELLHEPFQPERYKDEYREALMKLIEAKLEGQEMVVEATPKPTKVTDLMSALKASIEAAKKARGEAAAGEEAEAAPRRRRARAAAG